MYNPNTPPADRVWKLREENNSMSTIPQNEVQSIPGIIGRARHLNWSSIPVEQIAEGIQRQMVVGEGLMICRFRFAPFLITPEHEHPHEQISLVVSGRVRFFIEGSERIASPGDVLHFPPRCWHGATMMDEEVVLIDIFTPIREDFLG
jgi:quercetin dioxygenase-like cupin family protein